ncbi:MAG: type III-A CRISPR-associated RAMP protein Csm4 [Bacteroidota bacterium]
MKKSFTAVKLFFQSPLHLARGKADYETSQDLLHSDTLMAALFATGVQLFGEKETSQLLLGDIRISSAYPFWGEEYFFPKPMSPLPFDLKIDENKQGKARKKIQYLGKAYFERLLRAENTDVPEEHFSLVPGFLSDKLEKGLSIVQKEIQQRVSVPPMGEGGDSVPYYLERMHFHPKGGLFFLVKGNKETLDKLDLLLRLLGDNGLGTDRNVGNGLFRAERNLNFELDLPEEADRCMNLGLYCPLKEELSPELLEKSAYHLIKRGGYMASAAIPEQRSYRKRSVYMFREASVFPQHDFQGKYVNLAPVGPAEYLPHGPVGHSIWREGRSVFIPMIFPNLENL